MANAIWEAVSHHVKAKCHLIHGGWDFEASSSAVAAFIHRHPITVLAHFAVSRQPCGALHSPMSCRS